MWTIAVLTTSHTCANDVTSVKFGQIRLAPLNTFSGPNTDEENGYSIRVMLMLWKCSRRLSVSNFRILSQPGLVIDSALALASLLEPRCQMFENWNGTPWAVLVNLACYGFVLFILSCIMWRGGSIRRASTRDPKTRGPNPVRSTRTICESFSESKCCADSLLMCPTPVCINTHA